MVLNTFAKIRKKILFLIFFNNRNKKVCRIVLCSESPANESHRTGINKKIETRQRKTAGDI